MNKKSEIAPAIVVLSSDKYIAFMAKILNLCGIK